MNEITTHAELAAKLRSVEETLGLALGSGIVALPLGTVHLVESAEREVREVAELLEGGRPS